MNSVVEISGFAAIAVLAAPFLLSTFTLFLALVWPVAAGPVSPGTASASDLVPDRGELSLKSDQIGTHGLEVRAEQEPNIFYNPGTVTSKNNGMARDESAGPLPTQSPHNDVQTRPLPVPDAANLDRRAVQARDLLTKALDFRAAGDDVSAADYLRQSIKLASTIRNDQLHALARLELGDMAESEGDLITACEHWQLARSLFEGERRANDAGVCETRMARNGCPTDWVLTDF